MSAPDVDRHGNTGEVVASLCGVGKRFGPHWALRQVDLTLRTGEVLGFIGPNGAGKTTLMKLLAGLQRVSEGTCTVLGRRLDTGTLRTPDGVAAVLEESGFIPSLSGLRNLELLAGLRSRAGKEEISALLEQVGLDPRDRRPVRTWSMGMRQRLSLAQALMERPRLLLLDEPTNGLDPAGIVEMRGMLARMARDGTAILLASHLLTEVEQLCGRVLLVRRGVVLRELAGTGGVLGLRLAVTAREHAAAVVTWAAGAKVDLRRLPDEHGRPVFRLGGELPAASHIVRELVGRGVGVEEVGPVRQSLEEVFLSLTGSAGSDAGVGGSAQESGPAGKH